MPSIEIVHTDHLDARDSAFPQAAQLPDGYWAVPYQGPSTLHTLEDEDKKTLLPDATPQQNRWARWRPHRLCGVEAETEGRFTIPTVFRREHELRLNYCSALGGWIRVELLQAIPTMLCPDVDPLKGFTVSACDPLTGDEEDQVVPFKPKSKLARSSSSMKSSSWGSTAKRPTYFLGFLWTNSAT